MVYKSAHLSRREKKEVKRIAESVIEQKAEKKVVYVAPRDLNCQTTMANYLIPLGGATQGTGEGSRIGNQVQIDKIRIQGSLEPDTNTVSVCRIMMVQWSGIDSAEFAAGPLSPPLEDFVPSVGTIDNMHLWYQRKSDTDGSSGRSYKILYDQTFYFDAHGSGARKPFNLVLDGKHLKGKGAVNYSSATTSTYDNPVVLYGFGIDAVATLRYQAKVTYTDL